jgi:hypothetical protein
VSSLHHFTNALHSYLIPVPTIIYPPAGQTILVNSNFLVKLNFPKISDLHSSKAGIKYQHLRQKPTEIAAKYLVD